MELNLSKEQREQLYRDLAKAVPYDYSAPEMNTLDGNLEVDNDRWCATVAKRLLEQDDREKAVSREETKD